MEIFELKDGDSTILYYREVEIWNEQYLVTMRKSKDRRFISDDSILELWQGTLGDMSWVNPGMSQRYALEIYDRNEGYFRSIGPVIICDRDEDIDSEVTESLFKEAESQLSKEVGEEEYEAVFKEVLSRLGFTELVVGGGCKIEIGR